MDPAPAIGIGAGFAVVIGANVMEGGNPMSLLEIAPILLVFGTTVLITMAGGTMKDAKKAVASAKRAFTGNAASADRIEGVLHRDVVVPVAEGQIIREYCDGCVRHATTVPDRMPPEFGV
jgi:hypothetical protein